LLRFDSEGKQWKERGVGKVKIMQDPTTGKVRLLMRREQVLKVCCNHFVTADVKFTALSSSDRAWTWYAHDYSEGEMKPELFAIRFKTVEQALLFKKTLDEVQMKIIKEGKDTNKPIVEQAKSSPSMVWKCGKCLFPNASVANHCASCKIPKPGKFKESRLSVSNSSNQQPKLVELSKSTDSWDCQSCCLKNDIDSEICIGCKKPNSSKAADVSSASQSKPLSEIFKSKPGSWECEACYIQNQSTADSCMACETPKPRSSMTHETASAFSSSMLNKSDQTVPLSQLFKPKAGSWECTKCYACNDADKTSCVCCGGSKPGHDVTLKEMSGNTTNQASFKLGIPSSGTEFSFSTSSKIASGQSDFKFGIPPGHTSEPVNNNFGMPISNISTSVATATPTTQAIFTISNAGIPKGFSFGLPPTTTSSVTNIFGGESTSATKPFSFEPKAGTFLFGNSAGGGTEGSTSSLTFSFGSNIQTRSNSDSTPPKDTAGKLSSVGRSKFGCEIEPFILNQPVTYFLTKN
jgi:E3 SUMO-protein ligase RanBP2